MSGTFPPTSGIVGWSVSRILPPTSAVVGYAINGVLLRSLRVCLRKLSIRLTLPAPSMIANFVSTRLFRHTYFEVPRSPQVRLQHTCFETPPPRSVTLQHTCFEAPPPTHPTLQHTCLKPPPPPHPQRNTSAHMF